MSELSCLGLSFHAPSREIRNQPSRVWNTYYGIKQFLGQGKCDGHILHVISGNLVNCFLLQRCALSAMACIWKCSQEWCHRVHKLPRDLREELQACCALTRVAHHQADRRFSSWMCLIDASLEGYNILESRMGEGLAMEVGAVKDRWRSNEQPSEHDVAHDIVKHGRTAGIELGGGSFDAWIDHQSIDAAKRLQGLVSKTLEERSGGRKRIFVDQPDCIAYLPAPVVIPENWRTVIAGAFHASKQPIHIKEAVTSLKTLVRMLRRPECHGRTLVCLGDNLAEVLCTEKGRAIDRGLNCICQRAAAHLIVFGNAWRRRRVPNSLNVADDDSRLATRGILRTGGYLRGRRLFARVCAHGDFASALRYRRQWNISIPPMIIHLEKSAPPPGLGELRYSSTVVPALSMLFGPSHRSSTVRIDAAVPYAGGGTYRLYNCLHVSTPFSTSYFTNPKGYINSPKN